MPPRDPDELELDAARDPRAQPDDSPALAQVRRIGAAARALDDEDRDLEEPPPDLWAGIAARIAAQDEPGDDPDVVAPVVPLGARPGPAPEAAAPRQIPARRRGPGRLGWAIGAAAAAVLVVVAAAVVVTRDGDDGDAPVASAELEPLPDAVPGTTPGAAAVVGRDGAEELEIDATIPDADDGFYEVWLIDTAVEGMVSLGPLRSDGRYPIPTGVDVRSFPVVDVSIEPPDGDPTHSGVSVLRGTLA